MDYRSYNVRWLACLRRGQKVESSAGCTLARHKIRRGRLERRSSRGANPTSRSGQNIVPSASGDQSATLSWTDLATPRQGNGFARSNCRLLQSWGGSEHPATKDTGSNTARSAPSAGVRRRLLTADGLPNRPRDWITSQASHQYLDTSLKALLKKAESTGCERSHVPSEYRGQ